MPEFTLAPALIGGLLIGVSVSLMLLFTGRIAGISGILGGMLGAGSGDAAWRLQFLGGLVAGGVLLAILHPASLESAAATPVTFVALAGLLVGFGTRLGSGCTSGHGICGVSRLSPRSLVATLTFTISGGAAVLLLRLLGGI